MVRAREFQRNIPIYLIIIASVQFIILTCSGLLRISSRRNRIHRTMKKYELLGRARSMKMFRLQSEGYNLITKILVPLPMYRFCHLNVYSHFLFWSFFWADRNYAERILLGVSTELWVANKRGNSSFHALLNFQNTKQLSVVEGK